MILPTTLVLASESLDANFLSSLRTARTSSNVTLPPTLPSNFSTRMVLPGSARYCFPPLRITAYILPPEASDKPQSYRIQVTSVNEVSLVEQQYFMQIGSESAPEYAISALQRCSQTENCKQSSHGNLDGARKLGPPRRLPTKFRNINRSRWADAKSIGSESSAQTDLPSWRQIASRPGGAICPAARSKHFDAAGMEELGSAAFRFGCEPSPAAHPVQSFLSRDRAYRWRSRDGRRLRTLRPYSDGAAILSVSFATRSHTTSWLRPISFRIGRWSGRGTTNSKGWRSRFRRTGAFRPALFADTRPSEAVRLA